MKKQILVFLTVLTVLLCGVIMSVTASAETYSGLCGDDVLWDFNSETGELTLRGNGKMYDFTNGDKGPWAAYSSSISIITISKGITSIGDSAFYGCESLSSITIPNSVTSIGDSAFYDCYYLSSITIPNSVTSIGDSAFFDCGSLSSITIPNSVTSIGNSAFYGCYSLESITIPDSVTSIGDSAFFGCESLSSITIPDGVTSIGGCTFCYCSSLESITIPNSVTSIGYHAFEYCSSLESLTIPNSVTSIGVGAFVYCDSLKRVYLTPGSYAETWMKENGLESVINYGLDIVEDSLTVHVGDKVPLTVSIVGEMIDASSLVWASSNNAIATVEKGVVTTVNMGEVIITLSANNGTVTDSCMLTVIPGVPETADIFLKFEGYQVRSEGYNGLRSRFVVDLENMPKLSTHGYTVLEYGTVMASTDKLNASGDTLTVFKCDNGDYGTHSYARIIPVKKNGEFVGTYWSVNEKELVYYCTVTGFSIANYDKNVSIRGYAVIMDSNGEERVIYSDYPKEEYRSVNLLQICIEMKCSGLIDPLTCISLIDVDKFLKECGKSYGDYEVEEEEFFD